MSNAPKSLDALFAADRALRGAERAFLESASPAELTQTLAKATKSAMSDESEESEMVLVRIADLAAQVEGPGSVSILLDILDHESTSVRAEAGEALLDVAYERFKEVAMAIEKALDQKRDGLSMEELPYVLIEVHDPDPMPLIARFLAHPKAEIVASAVEAIVERADPSAVPQLKKLRGDRREVTMPELEDEKVTLGDLVEDALAFFEEALGEDEEEAPAPEKAAPARGPAGNERGGRRR